MRKTPRLCCTGVWLILAYLLVSCSPAPQEHGRSLLQFGTLIDITLYDVEPELASQALDQLEKDFTHYHNSWTPWQDSALSRTNRLLASADRFPVSPEIAPLIEQSRVLAAQSQGLFNPAIGKLIQLWQFHRHDEPGIKPPDARQLASLVALKPSMNDLQYLDGEIISSNRSVQLNFGAFAKGYAIDLSMKYLRSLGISNAVINAGGDLSVIGSHGDRPWKIGIRHPRSEDVIAKIEAQGDESIFTSGDYERYYLYQGRRYHHILDPRTGYPAEGTASVTVIHDNAGLADAAATALFIAGPAQWKNVARDMGISQVLLIDTRGNIHLTSAISQRIEFQNIAGYHILPAEPL